MKNALLFLYLILFSFLLHAQQNTALVNFAGVQYKDSVLLNFIMSKGSSCNGINIERSADSLIFSIIGDIQGICGSSDYEVPFQFIDKSPLINADNYYRLDLGPYGYSQVLKVKFVKFNIAGHLFYPNPCRADCSLFFENPTNAEVKFFIYHYSGREVFQKKYRGTQIEIDRKNLSSGIYYYRLIKNDEVKNSGKFVVL